MLERLPAWLAGIQQTATPHSRPAAAIVFAADHPVARHGVSAYPPEVTAAMVANFVAGGAAASVLCRLHGLPLHVADVGVLRAHPEVTGEVSHRRYSVADLPAGDLRDAAAMPEETYQAALDAGRAAVDRFPDARVLVLGEMGIANTTPATAVTAALLALEPEALVGPGTGIDAEALTRKREVIRDALDRLRSSGDTSPEAIVRSVGGREIAALIGAAHRAMELRIAILVDGFIVSAAMLAAIRIEPALRPFLWFGHRSKEPGHAAILEALAGEPLVDLGLRLGEASGALVALPLLDAACTLHAEMATFESATVPDRERPDG